MKEKTAQSVTVIGGADGPTTLFLTGRQRDKNLIRRIKYTYLNWINKRKRDKAKKKIFPGTHSLQEVIQYAIRKYEAIEVDSSFVKYHYDERKLQMLYALIQREKPELIGAAKPPVPPSKIDYKDEKQVRQWLQEIDDWNNNCMQRVKQLPEDAFPISYHLLVIEIDENGVIEIELEDSHGIMGVSYCGDAQKCSQIMKDIYLYYGVTQEDIINETERYSSLLASLSS